MKQLQVRYQQIAMILAVVVGFGVVALIGTSIIYAGKIYPGVRVNGLDVGGLDGPAASRKLEAGTKAYASAQLPITYNRTTLNIPVQAIGVVYDRDATKKAMGYGRHGSLATQIKARMRAVAGHHTTIVAYHYDDSKLIPFINQASEDITSSVANAALNFSDGQIQVTPSQPGHRLDTGQLVLAIDEALGAMSTKRVDAQVYLVRPTINEDTLRSARHLADTYVAAPLNLTVAGVSRSVDQANILSWVDVTTPAGQTDLITGALQNFYPAPDNVAVNLKLSQNKIGAFAAALARKVDQTPQNAVLAMQDGKLTVARASHPGTILNQTQAIQKITTALSSGASERDITLAAGTKPADINEANLDSLGIKDQLSHGQTFFPGSSSSRLTNIRVGAALYNDIILKPGEQFSFGKILGDVGPAQGYVPELVILGDHEEKQYGGGLCQVASTAYRAALLAGLPINERHNHSFAVGFYTAPFGVPGVDATIYYPQVDFKFSNDTGHYMLIQTALEGTTLTFDYFGTKAKSGEIRGPQFISGTSDATQPSHTVFWRDVKDLTGKVTKTDAIETYYAPSTNFPITKQFN